MKQSTLLFGLDDKPRREIALLAGFQHLLAVFGGIITAPLIIANGMNLSVDDTSYALTAALLISGVATAIQIRRLGVFGSGLLSIQGTSFTFIGPMLYSFWALPESMGSSEKLAAIFGSSIVAGLLMLPVCVYAVQLRRIFSPVVTGTTIILIGLTLCWTTFNNLFRAYQSAADAGQAWIPVLLGGSVFLVTVLMAYSRNPWLRLSSIIAGLGVGYVLALVLGQCNFSIFDELSVFFIPEPLRYGMSFDLAVFFALLPVFLVTATESVGDLTATSSLSAQPTKGPVYWQRIRGGLLGDALNTVIALIFATFPNTTFSQNNGVIKLTGIASRRVGYVVAILLIVFGLFPIIGGIFQAIPASVVYGSTLLMFFMVALAGVNLIRKDSPTPRNIAIVSFAVAAGIALSAWIPKQEWIHDYLKMFLAFPVSTGTFIALALELTIPRGHTQTDNSEQEALDTKLAKQEPKP